MAQVAEMTAELAVAEQTASGFVLPATPPAGARVQAWGLALVIHAALVALLLIGLVPRVVELPRPMVRLVFVEPPPPPPPPLGGAASGGTVAALPVTPEVPAAVKPKRLAPPRQQARVQPPEPVAAAVPERGPAAVQTGTIAGAVDGTAKGVAGGVSGGLPGGIVGGRGTGAVPAGQVAHPPLLIGRVTPQYPRAARQKGVQGLVLLEAVLDTDGRIREDIKVLQSIPELDAAATAALRRWRFRPARDERGRTVPVLLEVPIRFGLR
jgi:protein TonB